MSYILDALKKIEHEKQKKAGPDGRVNITGDLFHERKQPGRHAGIWKIAALLTIAVLVACGGTWLVLQRGSQKSPVTVRPQVPSRTITATPPPVPAPVPVQAPVVPVPESVAPPVPSGSKKTVNAEVPGSDLSLQKNVQQRSPASPPKQAALTVPPPADIKLTGIAWQDERAGRRAVINGFLLKEGAVVSGARITEIKADRVRFSTAAGVFELRLDGILPPEVKK